MTRRTARARLAAGQVTARILGALELPADILRYPHNIYERAELIAELQAREKV